MNDETILRDGSPSETMALAFIEAHPPSFTVTPAMSLRVFAAVSAGRVYEQAVHGVGIAIRFAPRELPQTFFSHSARQDGTDTWSDRGALGGALTALVWIKQHAEQATVVASANDHKYVVEECIGPLRAIAADDATGLEAFVSRKSDHGARANADQLRKLHRLVHALPNVTWQPVPNFDRDMQAAMRKAKEGFAAAGRLVERPKVGEVRVSAQAKRYGIVSEVD